MSGSEATTFSCSNVDVASIEKISNTCVKVYGLRDGEVVISATVGGKTAKYSLIVGNAQVTTAAGAVTETTAYSGEDAIDFSTLGQDQLSKYMAENPGSGSSATIILGIIGWAALLSAFGFVLSVIFRNRTPSMNMYPGTKARFNNSGTAKHKKRLLPDHYYRSIRKY